MKYPLHEVFHSFQGEGAHMGANAFFVRLFGCPVKCPWCDSAGTWHKDYKPEEILLWEAQALADAAAASEASFAVITGGEPTIHDLAPLCDALHARGLAVHLETAGAFPIKGEFDWITLSPKKWRPPIQANLMLAQEIKIIVEEPADLGLYTKMIKMDFIAHDFVWLHPEWSKRNNPVILKAISEAVKRSKNRLRAGYQLHKLYAADSLDARTQKLAPLGGDPSKGY